MNKQETIQIVTLIVGSYPAAGDLKKEETVKAMVVSWSAAFRDDDPQLVGIAVQKHIALNKWPPSVAEIRSQMVAISHPELVPPDVAWAAVSDILYANSGFSDHPYSTLPPLIVRCIEAIGWHNLREMHRGVYGDSKPGMDRVMFLQQYTPMYERERDKAQLPETLAAQCEKFKQVFGGETARQIDAAHQARIEKEESWNRMSIGGTRRLHGSHRKALPGGTSDDT